MDSPKPRVLAVDDAPGNLVALDAVLGETYDLVRASSGAEAIAILEKDPDYDVILMDVQMPGMDGYETAERIKKMPSCVEIPLVFITAVYSEDPHVKRGYEVGAMDYFTKPFDPDLLRLKLEVYASFHRRSRLLRAKEQQLRESEGLVRAGRKLAAVLDDLPVGVIIVDAEGRAFQANEEALRTLESVEAVENDAYGELLGWWSKNESLLKEGRSPVARAVETGESVRNEVVLLPCVDGTKKGFLISASPLKRLNGGIVGAVIVLQDMAERKKVLADLEERVARLVSLGVDFDGLAHASTAESA